MAAIIGPDPESHLLHVTVMSLSNPDDAFDVKGFLSTLTQKPGVYRMLDKHGEVIYVGKAKNLKKRVSSYFQARDATPKQQAMVARIHSIDVRITHNEAEALLLESQLIKRHRPRYNITLRDDKSYPAIYVSTHQTFPRVSFHRGAKQRNGRYFGPYPSASAVRESLKLLQKIFPVRQCQDSFFENRSRPCLEYQIERCTAPCVGLVSQEDYAIDVRDTLLFLDGDSRQLIETLAERMERASQSLEFERAAHFRDQIATLRTVLEKQAVHGEHGDLDIIACVTQGTAACIQMNFIRRGQQIGDRSYFPDLYEETSPSQILKTFIGQYYIGKPIPREILVNTVPDELSLLEEALSQQDGHLVKIIGNARGERAKRVQLALSNAENALETRLASRQSVFERYRLLGEVLGLPEAPKRMECFDISHTQGELTVASCVVFDHQGPLKSAYRRFNIEGIQPGDDYAALQQAVTRRYQRIRAGEVASPDVLFIDGGKGQISAVRASLTALGMEGILTIGIAKGPDRKPGQEMLISGESGRTFMLPSHSPALLLIQQIRDEAHRFAITGHRQRRAKARTQSGLDGIAGLGPKRRQQLLRQFGGIREIERASIDTLSKVEGISQQLAKKIYDHFHEAD